MKKVQTATAQRWKKETLDHLQDSKEQATKERFTDYIKSGTVPSTAIQFNLVPGSTNAVLNPKLTILPGVGYTKIGERILVSSIFDDITNPNGFLSTNPDHLSDNGLGVNISTPRSTGTQNIPLTLGQINKIWIGYIQVIDDSQFTLKKDSSEKQFFKILDGYNIVINATNPDVNAYLFLGQVDLTTDLSVTTGNISLDGRSIATLSNKTIDQGSGSLLDADLLDGLDSTEYQTRDEKDSPNGYAGLDQNRFINLAEIPQGEDSDLNADKIDGFHALSSDDSTLGTPDAENNLVALDASGKFPEEVIPPVPVPPAPTSPAPFRFLIQGTPTTATKVVQALNEFSATIEEFYTYVDNVPTGTITLSITITLNGSGFSTITYNAGDPQFKSQTGLSQSISIGDRIGVNISVTGAGSFGGEDILVAIKST